MSIHDKHMALIDAVNNAKNDHEYWSAYCTLNGFRDGVRACGDDLDLIAADLEQFARGHENRSMCCGVFTTPDYKLEQSQ